MEFIPTPIAGCYEIKLKTISDERGFFLRQFCRDEMSAQGILFTPTQSNYSMTKTKGTIRGLHYQTPPKTEAKLLRVLKGKIFDVCVDLRKGSATFAKWHSVELDATAYSMFLIPKGCAHGFQTLTDNVEMIYFHDEAYSRESDRTAFYADPMFSIPWPLPVSAISQKDATATAMDPGFKGYEI